MDQIVSAALKLAATSSLKDISMRELAAELGVQPPTLYNYVANKDALHELVLDHVLRQVAVPGPEAGPWDERMRQLQRSARRVLSSNPGIELATSGRIPQESLRLADGAMSILRDGGFDPLAATQAFSVLYTFMLGQREIDTFAYRHSGHAAPVLDDITHQGQLSGDELFEFAFDVLLDGLERRLLQEGSQQRTRYGPLSE